MCIFDMDNRIFKASIQVGNTSITTLALVQGYMLAGLSNGHFFKLQGKECVWNVVGKLELQCAILNITSNNQTGTVFVGTEDCSIYFIDLKNWKASIFSSAHTGPITDLCVQGGSNGGIFASIDGAGSAIVWQKQGAQNVMVNTFSPYLKQNVEGTTISIGDGNKVVTGWSNGNVKCFPVDQEFIVPKQEWEIPTAHKCPVTALHMDENYILTGGEDGLIRVWSRGLRKIVSQINFHTKTITRLLPDLLKPNLIHSCSMDKQALSYDLKAEKKIMYHTAKNGHLLDMTQQRNAEYELISCGFNNPITYWDIDVVAPFKEIDMKGKKCNCIDMSPSGKTFIVGTEDCMLYAFDTNSQKCLGEINAHSQGISKVKWMSDEKYFISTSMDGSMNVWKWLG